MKLIWLFVTMCLFYACGVHTTIIQQEYTESETARPTEEPVPEDKALAEIEEMIQKLEELFSETQVALEEELRKKQEGQIPEEELQPVREEIEATALYAEDIQEYRKQVREKLARKIKALSRSESTIEEAWTKDIMRTKKIIQDLRTIFGE